MKQRKHAQLSIKSLPLFGEPCYSSIFPTGLWSHLMCFVWWKHLFHTPQRSQILVRYHHANYRAASRICLSAQTHIYTWHLVCTIYIYVFLQNPSHPHSGHYFQLIIASGIYVCWSNRHDRHDRLDSSCSLVTVWKLIPEIFYWLEICSKISFTRRGIFYKRDPLFSDAVSA